MSNINKNELNDGSFDDKNDNTHQAVSLKLVLQNRVAALGSTSSEAEILNAVGPLKTIERLIKEGELPNAEEAPNQIENIKPIKNNWTK